MNEPIMTVNGQKLTDGEVMTIRVALNSLMLDMQQPNALGDDDHGRAMADGYQKCARATLMKTMNRFNSIDAQNELASLIRISPEEIVNEMD